MKTLSSSGWELVSTTTSPTGSFFVGMGEFETVTTAVFRRPIQEG